MMEPTYLFLGLMAVLAVGLYFVSKHGPKAVLQYRIVSYGVVMMFCYLQLPNYSPPHGIVTDGVVDPERLSAYLTTLHDEIEEANSMIRSMIFLTAIWLAPIVFDIAKILKMEEPLKEGAYK